MGDVFVLQLLLAKDLETVLALSAVSAGSNDRGPLATALLQIFRHEHQEAHLLRTLNDLDIDNEGEFHVRVTFLFFLFYTLVMHFLWHQRRIRRYYIMNKMNKNIYALTMRSVVRELRPSTCVTVKLAHNNPVCYQSC